MRKVVASLVMALLITSCAKWPPPTNHTPHTYPSPAETIKFIMLVRFMYGPNVLEEWVKLTSRAKCTQAITKARAFNAKQVKANQPLRIYVGCIWNPKDKKA